MHWLLYLLDAWLITKALSNYKQSGVSGGDFPVINGIYGFLQEGYDQEKRKRHSACKEGKDVLSFKGNEDILFHDGDGT